MTSFNVATVCHALAILIIVGISALHLTRDSLLPWYEAALGAPWDQLPNGVRAILASYMKLAGASQLAAALALGIVLFGPFRRGEAWANRAILAVGCLATMLSAWAIYTVQANTGVAEPWYNPLASTALFIAGFVIARGKRGTTAQPLFSRQAGTGAS
jgi:hypothetical protein